MKLCRKVGEGAFGEVFSTTNSSGDAVALKIIPVEGCDRVNGEEQKTFGEILHEIIISKELSSLKEKKHNQTTGFIGLKDLHCVQGCYPPGLLKAWDSFKTQRGSENDRPGERLTCSPVHLFTCLSPFLTQGVSNIRPASG
eukprot:XP_014039470.1 PREDICTED: serine/threonine-protein kinase haspin-like [Salmo salar]